MHEITGAPSIRMINSLSAPSSRLLQDLLQGRPGRSESEIIRSPNVHYAISQGRNGGGKVVHEASIAQAILKAIEDQMAAYGVGAEAKCVAVRCGEFRNVDPDSLRFAFESLRKDEKSTESCRLELEIVPAIAACKSGHEFNPQAGNYYACTTCGAGIQRLLQGEELDVSRVVIQTDE